MAAAFGWNEVEMTQQQFVEGMTALANMRTILATNAEALYRFKTMLDW